jgi:putative transposase
MVATPEQYPWSSYRAHIGLDECDWLDVDPCTSGLSQSQDRRQRIYREFVEQGIHNHELEFIRGAVQRNQLTGSDAFILQVEQLTGERILHRTRGRPRVER